MLQKTALNSLHQKQGAKLVDFAGWEMPVQYTSVKEEVLAVREKVGVFDVSHMGEFFVAGPDAYRFVDHLLPNNIANAPMGKAIYSPLMREDGTIIDDLIVYKLTADKLMICVNASNIDKDFNWIKSQLEGFNCELTNHSAEISLLALQGPKSFEVLAAIISGLPDMEYYSVWEAPSKQFTVARTGYTGEDGFEIFGNHQNIINLWQQLMDAGVAPCGLAARDVLRLEVCYPLYGHEIDDTVTPLDAGLAWTVKKDKIDFIGKSALTNYKAKYKLVKLLLDKGIAREGYAVCNAQGQKIGHVTSGTMSVVLNKGVALARIDASQIPADNAYYVDIRGKQYNTQVVTKPFVQGGHK